MIFVELQLRPSPPEGAVPYFWGVSTLTFYTSYGGEKIWEADLSPLPYPKHVEKRDGFGWVLVLEYTHEDAKRVLAGMGLPECVVGETA
jgi:hypothetical protein